MGTTIIVVIAVVVGTLVLANRLTANQREAAQHFMALLMIDWIVSRMDDAIKEGTVPDLDSIFRAAPDGAMLRIEMAVLGSDPRLGFLAANFRSAIPPVIRSLRNNFMKDRRNIPDDRRLLRKIIDFQEHVVQRVIERANAGHYLIGRDRVLRVVQWVQDNIDAAKGRCA